MREIILVERQARLEKFLNKIEVNNPAPHLASRWTKTLIELCLGQFKAKDLDWPNSRITFRDVFEQSGEPCLQMYVHTPVQTRVNAALKKLYEGYPQIAKKMLEALASEQGGMAIASEIQTHNRSNRNKPKDYEKLLDKIYKKNPKIGHKQLEKELHKHVGDGVIQRIDTSLGEIVLTDGRIFKLSGLKDQIYRRRKLL